MFMPSTHHRKSLELMGSNVSLYISASSTRACVVHTKGMSTFMDLPRVEGVLGATSSIVRYAPFGAHDMTASVDVHSSRQVQSQEQGVGEQVSMVLGCRHSWLHSNIGKQLQGGPIWRVKTTSAAIWQVWQCI
jgi:hypothetical protein